MPRFAYKAIDASGALVGGEMDALTEAAVLAQLQTTGHLPISAGELSSRGFKAWLSRDLGSAKRLSTRDLSVATHDLATLLEAGLALDRALELLIELSEVKTVRRHLTIVLAKVRDGASLADAMATTDGVFPRAYVSVVRAGEAGGNLDKTLQSIGDHLAKAHAVRETIKSALVYPTILVCTAALSITFILTFVLPQFEPLFRDAGKQLPTITRITMSAGNVIGHYGWAIALMLAALGVAIKYSLTRPDVRRRWDGLTLRIPLVGDLIAKIQTARFSRTLGTLIQNGVTLPNALRITQETLTNAVIAEGVGKTAANLRQGGGLAEWLDRTGALPKLALHLIRIGEETGKLEEMLLRQAAIYERETQRTVDRLLAIMVPALTLGLGVVVAGIIASMLVGILSINDLAL
jgi:general secretion pathway protein F